MSKVTIRFGGTGHKIGIAVPVGSSSFGCGNHAVPQFTSKVGSGSLNEGEYVHWRGRFVNIDPTRRQATPSLTPALTLPVPAWQS